MQIDMNVQQHKRRECFMQLNGCNVRVLLKLTIRKVVFFSHRLSELLCSSDMSTNTYFFKLIPNLQSVFRKSHVKLKKKCSGRFFDQKY